MCPAVKVKNLVGIFSRYFQSPKKQKNDLYRFEYEKRGLNS